MRHFQPAPPPHIKVPNYRCRMQATSTANWIDSSGVHIQHPNTPHPNHITRKPQHHLHRMPPALRPSAHLQVSSHFRGEHTGAHKRHIRIGCAAGTEGNRRAPPTPNAPIARMWNRPQTPSAQGGLQRRARQPSSREVRAALHATTST